MNDLSQMRDALEGSLFGTSVHVFDTLDSTNDAASALGRDGAPEGTLVLADRQTQGRGRLGRVWDSRPGLGLWFSVVLRPGADVRRASGLAMVGAMAVAVPLRERYELDAGVKWPNDVMIGSRKICGVLAESAVRGGAMDFAVIGIGINVLHGEDDFPEGVRGRATSVRLETRGPATRPGVLKDVATALEQRYRAFQREGFAGIRPELLGISPMIGGSVRVETGLERLEGTAIDIDQEGALVLMTAGGERRLWAGEVTGCAQLEPRRER